MPANGNSTIRVSGRAQRDCVLETRVSGLAVNARRRAMLT
jgi:hypothetical protein